MGRSRSDRLPSSQADPAPLLRLKPGREKSLRQRHPWIFSGAVDAVSGDPQAGATLRVLDADGKDYGSAAYSPASQIRARMWSFDAQEPIDPGWFLRRVERAVAQRAGLLDSAHNGCRLIHGEADGLPGVLADRYDDVVVLQLSSAGAEYWREAIVAALVEATTVRCVYERSDAEVRTLEGLSPRSGPLYGALPDALSFLEGGLRYEVDVTAGQKTGFYLDQRDNRAALRDLAQDAEALNVFCYSGGFSLTALAGGAAQVTSIDSSAGALEQARRNLARNPQLDASRATWIEADAFATLRKLRDAGRSYDLIVLDPPKFAPTAAHAERAARAYKDINLWALKLLRPGGHLATFSCSGGVDAALFRKIVAAAAIDAGTDAIVAASYAASADHPVTLAFPEGEYLKGLLLRKPG